MESFKSPLNGKMMENAQGCADYLVSKGISDSDAVRIVGRLVNRCERMNESLIALTLKDFRAISDAFEDDVYDVLYTQFAN